MGILHSKQQAKNTTKLFCFDYSKIIHVIVFFSRKVSARIEQLPPENFWHKVMTHINGQFPATWTYPLQVLISIIILIDPEGTPFEIGGKSDDPQMMEFVGATSQ